MVRVVKVAYDGQKLDYVKVGGRNLQIGAIQDMSIEKWFEPTKE